ncbi:hypothetical protein [Demequina rhizosphaerae]|uniref:hypothetical protein n=1 Tax=Demequina rhizosphaerae TaxID=1638985 RepID=UPI000784B3DB|nr:hypothetical protein [Demequina rhizosphaerae]
MPEVLDRIEVGEIAQSALFVCEARGHQYIDEVRLDSKLAHDDRRYRDGIRWDRRWSGYCACCGRRVPVTPLSS